MALISQEGGTKIYSNKLEIPFICGYELPASVKGDFDYLDDIDNELFIKQTISHDLTVLEEPFYHHMSEFLRYEDKEGYWHGIAGISAFSATLVRLCEDEDSVVLGLILC